MKDIEIVPKDFREMLATIPDKSTGLVVADWPFFKGLIDRTALKMYSDGVKEAARILTANGNFVSVHYLKNNLAVAKYAEIQGLKLQDTPIMKTVKKVKLKGKLGMEIMSIFVFSKSNNRIFNETSEFSGRFYSKKKLNIVTDFWDEKQFKPGWRRKAMKSSVPEAMPRWVVEKILNTYTTPETKVVDFFGGSGNFPVACMERGLECTASELNPNHFYIIKQRILETASLLIDKAIDAQPYTTGGLSCLEKAKENTLQERISLHVENQG